MAIHYICDRCGNMNTSPNDVTKLNIDWGNGNTGSRLIKVDLCNSCMRKLEDFCKPLPKEDKR